MGLEFDPSSESCLICSSTNLNHFGAKAFDSDFPEVVKIVECEDCAFAWQYPIARTESDSVEFFDTRYELQGAHGSSYFDPARKREIASVEFSFVSELLTDGNSLLDIGAGAGVFAKIASSQNFSVTAVDPALDPSLFEKEDGITGVRGTTNDLPEGRLFDVVTMWDVIEHMSRPIDAIRDAQQRLKKGGWLVIETGNYKSVERIRGGTDHWIYQLDHRWYFSPESISRVLSSLGFSEVVHCQRKLRPGWDGSVGFAGPSRSVFLKRIARNPLSIRRQLSEYMELRKARDWPLAGIGIFATAARL